VVRELVLEMLQHLLPVNIAKGNEGCLVVEARHLAKLFDTMAAAGRDFSLESMQECLGDPGGPSL